MPSGVNEWCVNWWAVQSSCLLDSSTHSLAIYHRRRLKQQYIHSINNQSSEFSTIFGVKTYRRINTSMVHGKFIYFFYSPSHLKKSLDKNNWDSISPHLSEVSASQKSRMDWSLQLTQLWFVLRLHLDISLPVQGTCRFHCFTLATVTLWCNLSKGEGSNMATYLRGFKNTVPLKSQNWTDFTARHLRYANGPWNWVTQCGKTTCGKKKNLFSFHFVCRDFLLPVPES